MKKTIFLSLLILFCANLYAQIGIGTTDPKSTLDINGNPTLATETDGLLPPRILRSQLINKTGYGTDQIGVIIYVTDLSGTNNAQTINVTEIGFYYFDGNVWQKLNNLETTYETIAIGTGNQTLTVRDADKIIGFTLISNYNSLSTNTGKMSGTWIINDNRDKIRCHIQTLEQPYMKFLGITVQINNLTNTIEFSNYTSRYWTITQTTPQNNLSNDGTNYELDKIVIIRKE